MTSQAPSATRYPHVPRRFAKGLSEPAHAVIGDLSKHEGVYALTAGQFSAGEALDHCIRQTGPGVVRIATWTINPENALTLSSWIESGLATDVLFLIDPSYRARKPQHFEALLKTIPPGSLRTIPIHAKFATITNDEWCLVMSTSMNFNINRRMEYVDIINSPELCCAINEFFDDVFEKTDPSINFTSQSLALFDQLAEQGVDPADTGTLPFGRAGSLPW